MADPVADPVRDYLAAIGRRGGQANTAAQNAARASNGKLGGRPPKRRKRSGHNNSGQPRLAQGDKP